MYSEKKETSERYVRCRGFLWMPGMRDLRRGRVLAVSSTGAGLFFENSITGAKPTRGYGAADWERPSLPDYEDVATIGCLEHLARGALNPSEELIFRRDPNGLWSYEKPLAKEICHGHNTKALAILAAWERMSW